MCGSLLAKLGMPAPDRGMRDAFNRELGRGREYDRHELDQSVQANVPLLNPQQKEVYDTLMKAIDGNGGLFFLDAPGGTIISIQSALANVLVASEIITWDECTMTHKRALEALHRTMKDLRNESRSFGGAMILLSGDFRRT
jgi:hypothetical protein